VPPRRSLTPPDPPLTDGVVLLRPVGDADVDQIYDACQDERLQRFIPVPRPYERTDAEAYVERAHRQWASGEKAAFVIVEPPDTMLLLGVISISIAGGMGNCGYWVTAEARGRGLARRALHLVTDWAFGTLQLAVVLLEINEANEASMEVAQAAGYHRSGRIDVNTETGKRGGLIYTQLISDRQPD
jgi:RimJ/RimL family protein N-acetyltransferase